MGGLRIMSNGIFENSYFKTSVDAFQAAITADVNLNGLPTAQAIQKNKGLIRKNEYTYIQPEYVNSFEVGYKGLWFQKRLYVDVDFYYNQYRSFMAQVEVNLPKTQSTIPDSLAIYLSDRTKNDRYRLWTNSKTTVFNYGSSAGVRFRFYKEFSIAGNVSYARLDRITRTDGLEEAFNTPRWITNVSVANPALTKHLGFGLSMRWQERFCGSRRWLRVRYLRILPWMGRLPIRYHAPHSDQTGWHQPAQPLLHYLPGRPFGGGLLLSDADVWGSVRRGQKQQGVDFRKSTPCCVATLQN